ncbi:MAG: biopolymer transporter ExbD [Bradymonadaceae bacterium]|nr:biopolymer transporter ExbD [Lujinxingiaceae bacterium]
MQFESYRREMPTINVSALIDVVFILLIFVVLAANFDRIREMNMVLPSADNSREPRPDAVVITVLADGSMRIFDEAVAPEALEGRLTTLRSQYEGLLLVSDGRVPLDRAVQIFDEAASAGFTSVSIATQRGAP